MPYLKTSKADVFYKIIGRGMPVVIIHGFSTDHRALLGCMEPMFKKVKGFKRIYLDLPGMGKTQNITDISCSKHMLDVVQEFIARIIPKQRFIIAGYSFGGYLVQCIASKSQRFLDGMLLVAPVVMPEDSKRTLPPHQVCVKGMTLRSFKDQAEKDSFDMMAVRTPEVWAKVKRYIVAGVRAGNTPFLDSIRTGRYAIRCNTQKFKKKFRKPVLIIAGRQDVVVGYKDALNVLDNYPRATMVTLDAAGHNLQYEQQPLFTSLVSDWLRKIHS